MKLDLPCKLCTIGNAVTAVINFNIYKSDGFIKFVLQCEICLQYFKSSQSFKKHKSEHLKKPSKFFFNFKVKFVCNKTNLTV